MNEFEVGKVYRYEPISEKNYYTYEAVWKYSAHNNSTELYTNLQNVMVDRLEPFENVMVVEGRKDKTASSSSKCSLQDLLDGSLLTPSGALG